MTEQPDPRVQFRQGALDAIPYDLIGSRAVGVGDARRYMIADAMWPLAERLIEEAHARGLAEGLRQATEGVARAAELLAETRSLLSTYTLPAEWLELDARLGKVAKALREAGEPAEQPEPARVVSCICPRIDVGTAADNPGAHHWVLGRRDPGCPIHGDDPEPSSGGTLPASGPTAEEAHQSFTQLPCAIAEAHERHTWSHKDEPCEGHVCPGVDLPAPIRVRHDPGELMEEPDLYEQCPDCLCCTRTDCAARRCGACPCTEG